MHFYVAIYSKVKTKKDLKQLVKDNPMNPKLDLQDPVSGRYATPNQIKEYLVTNSFGVRGPRPAKWYAELIWKGTGWSVK